MEIQKPDKKSLQYLGIIIIIAILVCIGYFYYLKYTKIEERQEEEQPAGKTVEEILQSLTAPELGEPISEELQESLSASDGSESSEDTENILKSLTAPE